MEKREVRYEVRCTMYDYEVRGTITRYEVRLRTRYDIILAVLIAFIPAVLYAQGDTGRYVHPHMFRAQATISPGYMFDGGELQIYLHGNLEYYADERVSLRGDGYYFLKAAPESVWLQNHSVMAGAAFHGKTNNHFDPWIGLQPGVNISQLAYGKGCEPPLQCLVGYAGYTKVNPVISPMIGFNYYFEKLFHLFGEARYIWGKHLANAPTYSLSEVRFSFGLGWNIN